MRMDTHLLGTLHQLHRRLNELTEMLQAMLACLLYHTRNTEDVARTVGMVHAGVRHRV